MERTVDSIELVKIAEDRILQLQTKSIDLSLNELADMHKNGELNISPEYQRLFRWDEEKQSRFIESLILEMPIPAIYVVETDDGIYDLVDGLQRISSYLHFRGEIYNYEEIRKRIEIARYDDQDDETDEGDEEKSDETIEENTRRDFLVLQGCDIIPELNGLTTDTLPRLFDIRLKRMPIRVEVIRKTSDPTLRYHLFKRLNTGGEELTAQEIRNCTIRILGDEFINFIQECANDSNFQQLIRFKKTKKLKQYDSELVLRYFANKNDIENYEHIIDDFLTEYLEKVTEKKEAFDYRHEKEVFCRTFAFLYDIYREQETGAFSITKARFNANLYDALCVGVAKAEPWNITGIDAYRRLEALKQNPDFRNIVVGGGQNTKNKLIRRISMVQDTLTME